MLNSRWRHKSICIVQKSWCISKNTYPKHVGHATIISAICVEFEKVCPLDLAKQIAVALVSRKLDYCNSLFHNMPEKDIARLQRVQNCLARVVITKTPRLNRSAPTLKRLHWLPVKFRIHFKIAQWLSEPLKTYLAYLADLLVWPKCSKYLRSTNSNRFVVPRIKTYTESRAFSMSGPALWNALPVPVRNAETILTFRKLFKSHLFNLAFPPYSSSSVIRLPVDEPNFASTTTQDHAQDLCASELGPLRT